MSAIRTEHDTDNRVETLTDCDALSVVIPHDISEFTEDSHAYMEVKARELATFLPQSESEVYEYIRQQAREYGIVSAPVLEFSEEHDI